MAWANILHVNKTSVLIMLDVNNLFLAAVWFSKSWESANLKSLKTFLCIIQHKYSLSATLPWNSETGIMQFKTHVC